MERYSRSWRQWEHPGPEPPEGVGAVCQKREGPACCSEPLKLG